MDNVSALYAFSISLWAKLNKKWVSTKGLFDFFVNYVRWFSNTSFIFQTIMYALQSHSWFLQFKTKMYETKGLFLDI